jgi:hypothetical protein
VHSILATGPLLAGHLAAIGLAVGLRLLVFILPDLHFHEAATTPKLEQAIDFLEMSSAFIALAAIEFLEGQLLKEVRFLTLRGALQEWLDRFHKSSKGHYHSRK